MLKEGRMEEKKKGGKEQRFKRLKETEIQKVRFVRLVLNVNSTIIGGPFVTMRTFQLIRLLRRQNTLQHTNGNN